MEKNEDPRIAEKWFFGVSPRPGPYFYWPNWHTSHVMGVVVDVKQQQQQQEQQEHEQEQEQEQEQQQQQQQQARSPTVGLSIAQSMTGGTLPEGSAAVGAAE